MQYTLKIERRPIAFLVGILACLFLATGVAMAVVSTISHTYSLPGSSSSFPTNSLVIPTPNAASSLVTPTGPNFLQGQSTTAAHTSSAVTPSSSTASTISSATPSTPNSAFSIVTPTGPNYLQGQSTSATPSTNSINPISTTMSSTSSLVIPTPNADSMLIAPFSATALTTTSIVTPMPDAISVLSNPSSIGVIWADTQVAPSSEFPTPVSAIVIPVADILTGMITGPATATILNPTSLVLDGSITKPFFDSIIQPTTIGVGVPVHSMVLPTPNAATSPVLPSSNTVSQSSTSGTPSVDTPTPTSTVLAPTLDSLTGIVSPPFMEKTLNPTLSMLLGAISQPLSNMIIKPVTIGLGLPTFSEVIPTPNAASSLSIPLSNSAVPSEAIAAQSTSSPTSSSFSVTPTSSVLVGTINSPFAFNIIPPTTGTLIGTITGPFIDTTITPTTQSLTGVVTQLTPPTLTVTIAGTPAGPISPGTSVSLTASTSDGNSPYSYSWTKNGVSTPFATSQSITETPPIGTTSYSVTITDKNGVQGSSSAAITVEDTTPPTVTGVPDRVADAGGFYNHNVTVSWAGDDHGGSGVASCDTPTIYSGPDSAAITLTGHCTDNVGGIGSGTFSLSYDATPPVISLSKPGPLIFEASGTLTSVDLGTSSATDSIAGSVPVTNDAPIGGFPLGASIVTYSATDSHGNKAVLTQSIKVVDTIAPDTSITGATDGFGSAIPDGGTTLSASIRISFAGSDAIGIAGYECSLDNSAFASCNTPVNYNGLQTGMHTVNVRARDTSNNIDATPAKFSWSIHLEAVSNVFGKLGSANGQFKAPTGVAVDGSGNVFVVDTLNNRVEKFNSGGSFIAGWGTLGSANGQFKAPTGVAVDGSGNVFVTDTGNNRIQKFTNSGQFVKAWGTVGIPPLQIKAPTGITVDSGNNVYVVDTGNNSIEKFDNNGVFVKSWGSSGSGKGQLGLTNAKSGIAFGATGGQGFIVVVDTGNNRIEKFSTDGTILATWGTSGTGNGQFKAPTGVAVNSAGSIYVVDTGNIRIEKLDSNGGFVRTFGTFGTTNGQFVLPIGIATASSGSLYIADTGNNRIEVFS